MASPTRWMWVWASSRSWWWTGKPGVLQSAAAAKSRQSCPTLCDLIDGSPPGSSVPGILQARTLEWVAISFSNAWKWKVKVKSLSHVWLLATPWTVAYQAPPSMGFPRQQFWSGVPLPSPVLQSMGWQRVRYDWVTELTEHVLVSSLVPSYREFQSCFCLFTIFTLYSGFINVL